MAYLIEATYEGGQKDIVILWSGAREYELKSLKRNNPKILWIRDITDELTEEECVRLSEKTLFTKYSLPREYRENHETVRRIKNERDL